MRVINKKISLDSMKSKRFGLIPGSVPVWTTPSGRFYSYETAKDSVIKGNHNISEITLDFEFKDIDLSKNPMGNYGLIPCDVLTKSMKSSADAGEYTPYCMLVKWYNFILKYNAYKGQDATAEVHYLLESSGGTVIESELEKCRQMDAEYEEIKTHFDDDPFEWMSVNLFGSGETETNRALIGQPGFEHGNITIPLIFTANIDELGEMSIFSERYQYDVFNNNVEPPHLEEFEVYHEPYFVDNKGKLHEINGTYMVYNDNTNSNSRRAASQESDVDYETIYLESTNDDGIVVPKKAVRYYDYMAVISGGETYMVSTTESKFNRGHLRVYDVDKTEGYDEFIINMDYPNGFYLIMGDMYEVFVNDFVEFHGDDNSVYNGREFPVYSATTTNNKAVMKYCDVGGKRYFAKGNKFYFKSPNMCGDDSGCEINKTNVRYIEFQGDYVPEAEYGKIVLRSLEFPIYGQPPINVDFTHTLLTGYIDIDNIRYYISDGKLTLPEGFDDNITIYAESIPDWGSRYEIDGEKLMIYYPLTVVDNTIITGHTSSKMLSVKDAVDTVDMLGNNLPGSISFDYDVANEKTSENRINTKYSEPYSGMLLELPYHVGNVSGLEYVKYSGETSGYVGNILTSMVFTVNFTSTSDTSILSFKLVNNSTASYGEFNNVSKRVHELIERAKTSSSTSAETIGDVTCEIRYSIGASLEKVAYNGVRTPIGGTTPYYYRIKKDGSSGVTYTERFIVTEEEFPYYTESNECIMVKYINLDPIDADMAEFKMNVDILTENGTWSNASYLYHPTNDVMMAPLGRKEYMLDMTMPQSVGGNIYVDRGINALYEKRLKLCEVKDVDALTRYGNNWFNIESYD